MENLDPNCNGTRIRADNQQENDGKTKNIIIKGRRVKKRVKKLQFDDSDDSQSDDDYKLNRRKANKQDGRADDANIFNLKNVFSNKLLSGKILSHWTDKSISANNLNLMETTNTLISKIANSGYETIFASIDKFEPLDGWNCDLELEQKSTTENINELSTLDKRVINDDIIDSNILSAEPEIEPVVKTMKEFIPENINQENLNKVDVGSKHSLKHEAPSTINPVVDMLSAKQIVDKSFGQAPAIVSSLNSWFSDIRSATKLAASSTVSHAVKKLTTNAQNILTSVASEQSDLWVPSNVDASLKFDNFNKTEQEVPPENVDSNDHWQTGDNWEEEWDEEPIKLTSIIKTESIDPVSSNFEELKTCDEIHKESIETSNVITNSIFEEQNLSEIQNDSPKDIEQSENFTIKICMPFDEEKQETFNIQSESFPASLVDPDDKVRLNNSNGDNLKNEPEIDLKILDELPKESQPIDEFSENIQNFASILKDSSSEVVAPNFVTNESTTSSRTANEELQTATITETWDAEWGDDTFYKQIESDKTTLPNLLEETVLESNSDATFIDARAIEQTSDVTFEHEHLIDGPALECLSWEADWNDEDTLNLTSKPIHSENTRYDNNANSENATVEEHIQSANNLTSTETFTDFIAGDLTSESFSSSEKITDILLDNPQSVPTDFICADQLTTNILNTKCIDNSMAEYSYQQIDISNSINVPLKIDESDHEKNEDRQSIEPNFVQSKSEMKISDDYDRLKACDWDGDWDEQDQWTNSTQTCVEKSSSNLTGDDKLQKIPLDHSSSHETIESVEPMNSDAMYSLCGDSNSDQQAGSSNSDPSLLGDADEINSFVHLSSKLENDQMTQYLASNDIEWNQYVKQTATFATDIPNQIDHDDDDECLNKPIQETKKEECEKSKNIATMELSSAEIVAPTPVHCLQNTTTENFPAIGVLNVSHLISKEESKTMTENNYLVSNDNKAENWDDGLQEDLSEEINIIADSDQVTSTTQADALPIPMLKNEANLSTSLDDSSVATLNKVQNKTINQLQTSTENNDLEVKDIGRADDWDDGWQENWDEKIDIIGTLDQAASVPQADASPTKVVENEDNFPASLDDEPAMPVEAIGVLVEDEKIHEIKTVLSENNDLACDDGDKVDTWDDGWNEELPATTNSSPVASVVKNDAFPTQAFKNDYPTDSTSEFISSKILLGNLANENVEERKHCVANENLDDNRCNSDKWDDDWNDNWCEQPTTSNDAMHSTKAVDKEDNVSPTAAISLGSDKLEKISESKITSTEGNDQVDNECHANEWDHGWNDNWSEQPITSDDAMHSTKAVDKEDNNFSIAAISLDIDKIEKISESKVTSIEGNDQVEDGNNANELDDGWNEDSWSDEVTSMTVLEKRSDDHDTSTIATKKSASTEPKEDMKETDKNQSLLQPKDDMKEMDKNRSLPDTVRTATISSASQAKIESNLEEIKLHNENELSDWDNFPKPNTFSKKNETRKALTKKTDPQASSTVSLPKSISKDQDIRRPAKKREPAILSLDQKNKVIDELFTSSTSTKASSSAQKFDDVSKKITAKKVGNNTNVDWSNDWNSEWDDDPEPITLPSHERRNSNLTNISIDSDWSADWECKPKAKPLPAPSRKSSTSSNASSVSKTVPEQHRQPHYYHRESQPSPPPKLDATFRGLDNESMSRRDYAPRPTGSSSSWFSELRSATRNAASTTMSHAVNRWSFNPTNILDAVVDNISNAVGIPSAEEMASVMSQQKKVTKNEK